MKLFAAHDLVRLAITAAGILLLLLFVVAMWDRRHQLRTEAVVEENRVAAHGKTNLRAAVYYQHTNGYDPRYPKGAVVETFKWSWGVPLSFAVTGALLTALGVLSRRKSRTPLKRSE
jgi:hypothetical protein